MGEVVLIADDDDDVASAVEINLQLEGYEVRLARNGREAIEMAREIQPDLVVLDVVMPEYDGFEVCEALRADQRTRYSAVILLTAKGIAADKVRGFAVGADDYIVKPFEPAELVARVRSVLRRSRQMRDLSPLTGLPGNFRISSELERHVNDEHGQFAVLYADLNAFKAYNDHYGFLRGDEVIKFTARVCTEALARHPGGDDFAGHVGGDDFVLITSPDKAELIAKEIIDGFDRGIAKYYDAEDLERGYVEVEDRQGNPHRRGLTSIAVGIATTAHREIRTQWEASVIASEMKSIAKGKEHSSYAVDRRGE